MTPKLLSPSLAYSVGSSLWVIPDEEHSLWYNQINWYINGLLSRAKYKSKPKWSETLTQLNAEEELGLSENMSFNSDMLMIATKTFLPNELLISKKYNTKLSDWVTQLLSQAKTLKLDSVRIFLPTGVQVENLQSEIKSIDPQGIDVTFVQDAQAM